MSAGKRRKRRLSWDEWYVLAWEYRNEHGDLLVPKDYVCFGGERLGRWIERQRAKYNGVPSIPGPLERTQIALLNEIGMVWKLENRYSWQDWMDQLDWYRSVYGNIDVPHEYERGAYRLGNWLAELRKKYAAGRLSARQIKDMEDRGVSWSLRTNPRSWEDWYAEAEAYYREHGDLMVPAGYRTPSGSRLGLWIYKQRDLYMGRKAGRSLSQAKVELLEALHMVWEPLAERQEDWERMYAWVSEYRERHGKLPLWPRDLKAPDGRSMESWIRAQRQKLAEGKLSPDRRRRLAELGVYKPVRTAEKEPA